MKALSPRSDSRRAGTDDAPHRNGHAGSSSSKTSSHKPSAPHALDPFGIYGTRTAHRMRAARRRRTTQNLIFLFLLLAGAAIFFLASRIQHTPVFSSTWQQSLMVTPAAAPVWASDAAGSRLLIPTDNGLLLSVDVQSGEAQKILATAFPLRAQPVIVDNATFVACEDGTLYVVDWRSGRHLWSYPTRAAMTARPALTKILLPAPAKQPHPSPSHPVAESAPRSPDASSISATPVAALSPVASGASPRHPDDPPMPRLVPKLIIITGNDEGLVTALEAGNGRVLWKRKVGGPVGNGITTATVGRRSLVLVPLLGGLATRGGLWCLDAKTGAPLWKFPQKSKAYSAQLPAPAVAMSATGQSGHVYCVDDSG
ncbi:MAG: PQQ-binding-like beta-propeller repeat protein, partial [Armatimonadota bacterium]|nr:PQQ-binding-like beta-propeller repeat protein [Armatimonadota bacterium]